MRQRVQKCFSPIYEEVYRGESEDKRRVAVVFIDNKTFKVNVFEDGKMLYYESKRIISSFERAIQVAESWINYQLVSFYDICYDVEEERYL